MIGPVATVAADVRVLGHVDDRRHGDGLDRLLFLYRLPLHADRSTPLQVI